MPSFQSCWATRNLAGKPTFSRSSIFGRRISMVWRFPCRMPSETMPYRTGIRLSRVARNLAKGFPARLLGGGAKFEWRSATAEKSGSQEWAETRRDGTGCLLNKSQGDMCICLVLGIRHRVSHEGLGLPFMRGVNDVPSCLGLWFRWKCTPDGPGATYSRTVTVPTEAPAIRAVDNSSSKETDAPPRPASENSGRNATGAATIPTAPYGDTSSNRVGQGGQDRICSAFVLEVRLHQPRLELHPRSEDRRLRGVLGL